MSHIPVLFNEVIDLLNPTPGGLYVDGTVGAEVRGVAGSVHPEAD